MEKETSKIASPFFSILSEAEEIKVREIPDSDFGRPSTLSKSISDAFEASQETGDFRAFVVRVKSQPAKTQVPAQNTRTVETAEDRINLLQKAKLLLTHSEVLLARHIYSYLLKSNIRDKDALQGLGHCLLRLGDSSAAKKCFRAIWEIYQIPECLVYLAICYALDGDDRNAVLYFEKVVNTDSLEAEARFEFLRQYGNSLVRLGNLSLAKQCYQRALETAPNSDIVYTNLGTLELQQKDIDAAMAAFEQAIHINPASAKAHCGVGLSAMTTHDWLKAKTHFELALNLDSQNTVALGQLWHIAQATDDHTFIMPRLEKYLEIQPKSADAQFWLAACYFQQGKWQLAEQAVDIALGLEKTHPGAVDLKTTLTQNRHQKWEGI